MANSETSRTISGEKTVTSAGTAEPIFAAKTLGKGVVLVAKSANTGQVYVGGSDVASTTNDGLDAGESLPISSSKRWDLAELFIDVDVDGDGVDIYAVKV